MAIIKAPPPAAATAAAPQPALLVSSALHLMTHYSAQASRDGACLKLASVIERHMKALAGHAELDPVLRATCQLLAEQWAAVVDRAMPPPARRSLFGRLVAR
jgi:hypothetical protein